MSSHTRQLLSVLHFLLWFVISCLVKHFQYCCFTTGHHNNGLLHCSNFLVMLIKEMTGTTVNERAPKIFSSPSYDSFDLFNVRVHNTAWYDLRTGWHSHVFFTTMSCKCHVSKLTVLQKWRKKQQQTCNSILALSFVFLVICFRLISAPVRLAFPDELQSPIYVGRPGVPISCNREIEGMEAFWLLH